MREYTPEISVGEITDIVALQRKLFAFSENRFTEASIAFDKGALASRLLCRFTVLSCYRTWCERERSVSIARCATEKKGNLGNLLEQRNAQATELQGSNSRRVHELQDKKRSLLEALGRSAKAKSEVSNIARPPAVLVAAAFTETRFFALLSDRDEAEHRKTEHVRCVSKTCNVQEGVVPRVREPTA